MALGVHWFQSKASTKYGRACTPTWLTVVMMRLSWLKRIIRICYHINSILLCCGVSCITQLSVHNRKAYGIPNQLHRTPGIMICGGTGHVCGLWIPRVTSGIKSGHNLSWQTVKGCWVNRDFVYLVFTGLVRENEALYMRYFTDMISRICFTVNLETLLLSRKERRALLFGSWTYQSAVKCTCPL